MDRLSPAVLADAIRNAPAHARLGLSMRYQRFRDRAADVLAEAIVDQLFPTSDDRDQLALPLSH